VTASKFPFPTVCADRSSTDWFSSISRTLKWNERERQKSFVVVEENPGADAAGAEDDGFDIDVIEDDSASAPASSSASSASSTSDAEERSPGVRAARETMLQPDERALGREKTREDAAARAPHSARHVAFAAGGGDRGRGDNQRTPTLSSKAAPKLMRSRSAEARHYHPRAFAVWGQDESESENTASDDEK
jgi:NAD+ kinase